MQYTTTYRLSKPDYTDIADISVLNANLDIIDQQLAERVTLGTEQTITGKKTFSREDSDGITIKRSNIARSDPSSGYVDYSNIRFIDKNDKVMGRWNIYKNTDSLHVLQCEIFSQNDKDYGWWQYGIDKNGNRSINTNFPIPTQWNVVTTDTPQTISATKTIFSSKSTTNPLVFRTSSTGIPPYLVFINGAGYEDRLYQSNETISFQKWKNYEYVSTPVNIYKEGLKASCGFKGGLNDAVIPNLTYLNNPEKATYLVHRSGTEIVTGHKEMYSMTNGQRSTYTNTWTKIYVSNTSGAGLIFSVIPGKWEFFPNAAGLIVASWRNAGMQLKYLTGNTNSMITQRIVMVETVDHIVEIWAYADKTYNQGLTFEIVSSSGFNGVYPPISDANFDPTDTTKYGRYVYLSE